MSKAMVCNRSFQMLFVIFISTAIISQTAHAKFIIDDFESGLPVHLSVDQYKGEASTYEEGLPVPSGKRQIFLFNGFNPTGTVTKADIDITPGDDALRLSGAKISADRGSSASIWYRDLYDGLSLDATLLGDRFYVILSDDPGTDVSMSISLQGQSVTTGAQSRWYLNGSGYYEILFSVYPDNLSGLELTNITGLALNVDFRGTQQEFAITEWGIVPEPASVLLLTLGGIFLTRRKQ
jgi:hypothetical protein